jgi:hypothetical protein
MRIVLLLTLFCGCMVHAAPADTQCDQALCWQVQPVVCIANQTADRCQLDFQLSWQHPQPISVCAALAGESLHCWQQQTSGQLLYQAQLDGPSQLNLMVDGKPRLTRQLSVLSRQPERKRRLVAPWSVF